MRESNDLRLCLKDYYQRKMALPLQAQQVGWKNDSSQNRRFRQLVKVLPEIGALSINDLGCGLGALLEYLQRHNYETDYAGYDVIPEMIEQARRKFKLEKGVYFEAIEHAREMREADYSVASGIFNVRGEKSNDSWLEHMLETIGVMNEKSRDGFAFNALTSYSDAHLMVDELYYADPCFMFDYCKRNFSRDVALLHDYQEYDFTIIVRKNFSLGS